MDNFGVIGYDRSQPYQAHLKNFNVHVTCALFSYTTFLKSGLDLVSLI